MLPPENSASKRLRLPNQRPRLPHQRPRLIKQATHQAYNTPIQPPFHRTTLPIPAYLGNQLIDPPPWPTRANDHIPWLKSNQHKISVNSLRYTVTSVNHSGNIRHLTDSILPIDWNGVCMQFVYFEIVWRYTIHPYETLWGYLITGVECLG